MISIYNLDCYRFLVFFYFSCFFSVYSFPLLRHELCRSLVQCQLEKNNWYHCLFNNKITQLLLWPQMKFRSKGILIDVDNRHHFRTTIRTNETLIYFGLHMSHQFSISVSSIANVVIKQNIRLKQTKLCEQKKNMEKFKF